MTPAASGIPFTLLLKSRTASVANYTGIKQTVERPSSNMCCPLLARASVPAGFVVWVRDDDELGVGNDGRPLLLPDFLGKHKQHKSGA